MDAGVGVLGVLGVLGVGVGVGVRQKFGMWVHTCMYVEVNNR